MISFKIALFSYFIALLDDKAVHYELELGKTLLSVF